MLGSFRLGPLQGALKAATYVLFSLPILILSLGFIMGGWARSLWVPVFLLVLYLVVWLVFRPRELLWEQDDLVIRFPLRTRRIPKADIERVEVLSKPDTQARLGSAVRFGVGGLFGVFGRLWTSREGFVDVYLTRSEDIVWIHRRGGRPILVTPETPHAFAEAFSS